MDTNNTEKEVTEMCNFGEVLYEEALEKGIEQGIESTLIEQIKKKINKGKNIITIADEVEESEEYVLELIKKYELAM